MIDFIQKIYKFSDPQLGAIEIMQHMDVLVYNNNFKECDLLLESVDINRLPIRMVLAFVTITQGIPDGILLNKQEFINRVRQLLIDKIGEERAKEVLGEIK